MSDTCDKQALSIQLKNLYTELALHPEKEFGWRKGKENAISLGYDQQ